MNSVTENATALNDGENKNFALLLERMQYASSRLNKQIESEGMTPSVTLRDILANPGLQDICQDGVRDIEKLKQLIGDKRRDAQERLGATADGEQTREQIIADVPYRAALEVLNSISKTNYNLTPENGNYLAHLFIGAAHHRADKLGIITESFLASPEDKISDGRKTINAYTQTYDTILQPQSFDLNAAKPQIELYQQDIQQGRFKMISAYASHAIFTAAGGLGGATAGVALNTHRGTDLQDAHLVIGTIVGLAVGAGYGELMMRDEKTRHRNKIAGGEKGVKTFTELLENPPEEKPPTKWWDR